MKLQTQRSGLRLKPYKFASIQPYSEGGPTKSLCAAVEFWSPHPQLTVLAALNLIENINQKYGTHLSLIGTDRAYHLEWAFCFNQICSYNRHLSSFRPYPTNTLVAHERRGQKLGSEIVYTSKDRTRTILSVPKEHQGAEDIALVIPSITAENFKRKGRGITVTSERIETRAIPYDEKYYYASYSGHYIFPSSKQSYCVAEPAIGFTYGEGPYIGPVVINRNQTSPQRHDFDDKVGDYTVDITFGLTDRLNILVYLWPEDLEKLKPFTNEHAVQPPPMQIAKMRTRLLLRGTPEQITEAERLLREAIE